MEFTRIPPGFPDHRNVEETNQWDWDNTTLGAMLVGAPEKLKLLELTEIMIDGLPAIRRLYEYPLVDPATFEFKGTQYNYRLYVMTGKNLFKFRIYTNDSEEYQKYLNLTDKLVSTIVFKK